METPIFQIRWVRGDSYLSDQVGGWRILFVRLGGCAKTPIFSD